MTLDKCSSKQEKKNFSKETHAFTNSAFRPDSNAEELLSSLHTEHDNSYSVKASKDLSFTDNIDSDVKQLVSNTRSPEGFQSLPVAQDLPTSSVIVNSDAQNSVLDAAQECHTERPISNLSSGQVSSNFGTPTVTTVSVGKKVAQAKKKFVKLPKCPKSPKFLQINKRPKTGGKNLTVIKKKRFLGVGIRKASGDEISPHKVQRQMIPEGMESEDKKKQASLHKMKRERKVSVVSIDISLTYWTSKLNSWL